MSIINKIVIPCLAISLVTPSCFYNALVAQSPQIASYDVCYGIGLDYFQEIDCVNVYGNREDDTSYTPSFTYSYQCSSAFLTDYVPVFIFMFMTSSLLFPLISFLAEIWYEGLIRRVPSKFDRFYHLKITFLELLLPKGWKNRDDEIQFRKKLRQTVIHRKQLLSLRVGYSLAVFMVFGSLFPPLAFVAMVSIFSISLWEERIINLMNADELELPDGKWILNYMEEESRDIERNFYPVLRVILFLTCAMYGLVLFDICGDVNGWKYGLIPLILMTVVVPIGLYFRLRNH